MSTFERTIDDASKTVKASPDWASPYFYALDFDLYPPSVANLPAEMTIAGTTVYPSILYNSFDAGSSWAPRGGYGESLTLAGNGTGPTTQYGSPLLGSVDSGVKFAGTGGAGDSGKVYYGSTSLGDITTEDVVVELVAMIPTNMVGVLVAKKESPSETGWVMYHNGLSILFQPAVGATLCQPTVSMGTYGAYYHAIWFCDRSGSAVGYLNATAGTPVTMSGVTASWSNSRNFAIGGYYNNDYRTDACVLYFAMWKQSAWLDTHLQSAVAKQRFARLCGLYPLVANGTYVPTTMARTSAGYLDKIEANGSRKLYYMGAGWPRVCKREDASANVVKGVLVEAERINSLKQSNNLHTSPWGHGADATVTEATEDVRSPDGTYNANKLEGLDNANGYVSQAITGLTNGQTVAPSFWLRRDTDSGVLRVEPPIGASGGLWLIDLSGVPDEWVWISRSSPYISVSAEWQVATSQSGLFFSRDGAGSDLTVYIAFCSVEVNYGTQASSYIPTTTAAATRYADSLVYNPNNWPQNKGRLTLEFLRESHTPSATQFLLEAGSAAESSRVDLVVSTSNKAQYFVPAQVNLNSAGDANTGNKRVVEIGWEYNRATLSLDGVAETPDTSLTPVAPTTGIHVGCASNGQEAGGLISKVRIDT